MGAQKSSESSSQSGSAQKWANPYARDAVKSITGTYNRYQPTADRAIAGAENIGGQLTNQYSAGTTQAEQGRQYYGDVLSGKYMAGNPYMTGMIHQMQGDVGDRVNSQFALAGRYGSGAHTGMLTKELANAENQLLYNDYNSQMGRMDNAAQSVGAMNGQNATLALGAQNQLSTMPYTGMQAYSGALGNLFNGSNSKSVSYAPNPIWGAIGAGLGAVGTAAAGGAFSDRRLKKDIVELGIRPDGLMGYEWTYRFDPEAARYRGVMAEDVKTKRPEAFIENYNGTGFHGVNYAALGTPMIKLAA